ncbi:acyl-CoA dehydrogenase [Kitasatospora phosalacinea]|uniref:Acyl-CoA dehydrogenase n=1 Tax=Kitasatospora phosalacinea TaxID=2065 RepID=A0A9W6QIA3_9ACTN|nr:acyl-CoA dehydrogenase family protein [Kitasatospora phosalacinea]GLW75448.1 acyl-CoA dehydrogenase [Kitasatospora phosalacinea]
MEFGWTPVQQRRYDEALAAARAAFPRQDRGGNAWHESGPFGKEGWQALGALGALGASVPTQYGGRGLGALDTARLFEAVGRGSADSGVVFAAAAHLFAAAMPIAEFGSPAVRERLLPRLCSGDLVAANAMTEPEAGSDVSQLATTATRTEGGYLLNGTKSFVSNGPVADVLVTYASTDPAAGHLGLTAFVVDAHSAGVLTGQPFAKLGMTSCPASQIEFRDCFVPDGAVLGAPGQGGAVFQHSMTWERTCLFALFLGVQDELVDRAVAHARRRRQFGKRLAEFQSVSDRIVDMKLRVEGARLLLYRACWAIDTGERAVLASALSKLAASQAAVASATDAVLLFGGRGYTREEGVEAALRDAVGGLIFSGTSDIQRQLAAVELGL